MKKQCSYYLDADVDAEIKKMAASAGLPASVVVNRILRGGLDSRREVLAELESIDVVDLVKRMKSMLKVKRK